ncbi:phosphatidylinositol-glycan biosynthesis class X protein [Echeneis naucrates]|uniref:Phosphatidylinositol-glycan biosynthesis class X protein n=1 Tax=Echeneis naucrates TaxID=173247 RepID=A0A665VTL2_ECHNA|nr:phosphatidylinositol-glycan biosynthesis class X protein [Echeneis naucrates]
MYFVLVAVLTCLATCHCLNRMDEDENHCGQLKQWLESTSVSVSVDISKKGFHRDLITNIDLSPDVPRGIRVLLVYRWPSGVYVDPYQLASLRDQSDWQILLDSSIDLEVPAHKTLGFVTYVYPNHGDPPPRELKVVIPMHGRYHEPSSQKTFTSVDMQPPELLLQTEKCMQLNSFEPHAIVDAPCTVHNSSMCPWVKVQFQQEHGPVSFQLPVGDGSLVIPVCSGTLLVTIICCVLLSKYTWKHRISL